MYTPYTDLSKCAIVPMDVQELENNMRIHTKSKGALVSGAIILSGLLCQTAQAQETLADLAAGGTLAIGDKTFSGFSYSESGLISFDASEITVTATAAGNADYLTWTGNISLASIGALDATATGDLLVNYVVTATGGNAINEVGQNYTGTVASGSATIGIAETVTAPNAGGATLGSTYLNDTYTYEPNFSSVPLSLNSSQPFINPPQSILDVMNSISLGTVNTQSVPGFPGYYVASVGMSQVQQSFEQIPEPATIALLLPPFGATALHVLRKKLKAYWKKGC
jgi:hypothetical protein